MKVKTHNKDYWKKRMSALEDEQYQKSAAYYKDIQRQYTRAENSIQMDISRWYQRLADNNDISYAGAKKLLKKNELEEFQWTIDEYIKAGRENAIDQRWMKELENASARHHITYLEAMKLQMQQHAELLSAEFEGGMTDYLRKAYGEQYYHAAFEVAKGTGAGSNLARLDTRKIDAMIRKPWAQDGANFSDRIWSNKEKLVNTLHTELTQNIIRGASPKKAIDSLSKTMGVSRSQAGRLIMTESAAISSAAQKECFNELGVERYQILASLDSSTCDICQALDGKVFTMKEHEVGLTASPFHPNCRCTEIPYFNDAFTDGEQRAARGGDGKTYYVPANMKYGEWKEKFVDKSEPNGIIKINRAMSNGQRTSPHHILSDDEKQRILTLSKEIGLPTEVIKFNSGTQTGFDDNSQKIHIRGDIIPDFTSTNLRDLLSEKAVLAHEYYGHYKNHPSAFRVGDWRDEFRASYCAAINTPGLSDEERRMLMLDAYDRAREAGVVVKYNRKARGIIYGYE